MSLLALLNKKNAALAVKWIPSLATFGATAGAGVLYFTDWRVINQYIPIYNTKFKDE